MITSYLYFFYRKVTQFLPKPHRFQTILAILVLGIFSPGKGQSNQTQTVIKKPSHYRGLCVINDSCAWFSGSKGTVIRTNNGGISFDTISPFPSNTHFAHFLPNGNQTIEAYNRANTSHISLKNKDFRDIWAKNNQEAVIMSAGDSAVILKTQDGGKNWTLVHFDFRDGIFLDALEIDSKTGIGMVLGDPILPEPIIVEITQDQKSSIIPQKKQPSSQPKESHMPKKHFAALYTLDFGSSWNQLPVGDWNLPQDSLESFFAASGSSLIIIESNKISNSKNYTPQNSFKNLYVGFAGGGIQPCYHIVKFKKQKTRMKKPSRRFQIPNDPLRVDGHVVVPLPMMGGPAAGVYGMCSTDDGNMIAVGGNYTLPNNFYGASSHSTTGNFGFKWASNDTPNGNTGGYRSGVCISGTLNVENPPQKFTHSTRIAICTGTNGSDISFDEGRNWQSIAKQTLKSGSYFDGSFNACSFSSNFLWMVGNTGKFQRIPISDLLHLTE